MATTAWSNHSILDAACNAVATANTLRVCSGTSSPMTRSAAIVNTLATTTLAPGDFTLSDAASGRQVTIAAKLAIPITVSGDATCITLDDGTNLIYVTPCMQQSLTAGGTVTVPDWSVSFADPVPV